MQERSTRAWFAAAALLGGALLAFAGCAGRSTREKDSGRESSAAAAGASATGGEGGTAAATGGTGGTRTTGTGGAGGSVTGSGGTTVGVGGTRATGTGGSGGTGARASGGGGAGGTSGSGGSAQGGEGGVGVGGAPERSCLLARRLDQCCAPPEPVTADEYEANPCWSLWDPTTPPPPRPGCTVSTCTVSCPRLEFASREVAPTPGGTCAFAPECTTVDDCVLLWDSRTNCACNTQPLPRSYEGQGCWVLPSDPPPPGCGPGADLCNCAAPAPLSCVPTPSNGGRCVAEYLPHPEQGLLERDDRCVAEKQCPAELSGVECPVCVAPGGAACGGPPPPPAGCATDADCLGATNYICEAAPCSNRQCIAGCIADTDCAPSEVCGDDHRCAPAPCSGDADCHPNRVCSSDGHCHRRSCTLSSECCTQSNCGGYCVNNLCYEVPGTCQDACAP